jgi:hypothetical protein
VVDYVETGGALAYDHRERESWNALTRRAFPE